MKKLLSLIALLGVLGLSGLAMARRCCCTGCRAAATAAGTRGCSAGRCAGRRAAAPAAAPAPVAQKLDSGNTAWMLTSTALVLFMTIPGLALFYGGMVRKKNVLPP